MTDTTVTVKCHEHRIKVDVPANLCVLYAPAAVDGTWRVHVPCHDGAVHVQDVNHRDARLLQAGHVPTVRDTGPMTHRDADRLGWMLAVYDTHAVTGRTGAATNTPP